MLRPSRPPVLVLHGCRSGLFCHRTVNLDRFSSGLSFWVHFFCLHLTPSFSVCSSSFHPSLDGSGSSLVLDWSRCCSSLFWVFFGSSVLNSVQEFFCVDPFCPSGSSGLHVVFSLLGLSVWIFLEPVLDVLQTSLVLVHLCPGIQPSSFWIIFLRCSSKSFHLFYSLLF